MYNLYCSSYENMAGILRYKEPNEQGCSCYECSTLKDRVNAYGRFIQSYKTFETAKEGALYRNENGWGDYNKDNPLRIDWSKVNIADVEKEYNKKVMKEEAHIRKLQLLFAEKYQDVYMALAEHDTPGNDIDDITEKLHITREDVIKMWKFTPVMFCKR